MHGCFLVFCLVQKQSGKSTKSAIANSNRRGHTFENGNRASKKSHKYKRQKLFANELMRHAKVPSHYQRNNVLEDLEELANFLQVRISDYNQHIQDELALEGPSKELIILDEIFAAAIILTENLPTARPEKKSMLASAEHTSIT